MSRNQEPVKIFLNGVAYLVQTAETYAVPQTPDEYHMAMQARADAEALMDYAQQSLMFLMQRLKKLPPLPEYVSFNIEKKRAQLSDAHHHTTDNESQSTSLPH